VGFLNIISDPLEVNQIIQRFNGTILALENLKGVRVELVFT
jgi:hypothetical protein